MECPHTVGPADPARSTEQSRGLGGAEAEMRELLARHDLVVAASGAALWEEDSLTGALTWYGDLDGDSPLGELAEAATAEEFFARIHPEDRARMRRRSEGAIHEGQSFAWFEYRAVLPRHGLVWFQSEGGQRTRADGTVMVTGLTRDITGRKLQEERHARALERLQLALSAGRMWVWELDLASGEFTEGGVDGPPVAGTERWSAARWAESVHPEDKAAVQADVTRAIATGETVEHEFRVCVDGAEYRWLSSIVRCHRDADGVPSRLLGVTTDVTERRAEQDMLAAREEQLRQAQKMQALGQLAGGVAHDFNNVLTAILGFAELLELRIGTGHEEVEQIQQAGRRARGLVEQLMAFGRVRRHGSGGAELATALHNVGGMLQPLLPESVRVRFDIAPSIGTVPIDESQIEQVLLNLAVNARDAMPDGGELEIVAARVELDTATAQRVGCRPGPAARLTVRDNGSGIGPEIVGHVFEPFFTTKDTGEGTGMGLATVYGIVTGGGGNIQLDSIPELGTTVTIHLPLTHAVPADSVVHEGVHDGDGVVLLVEDQEQIRTMLASALRLAGYEVHVAADGIEAQRLADQLGRALDVLVTDVVMPNLNGAELAQTLRARCPRLRVLFMSGYTARHDLPLDEEGIAFLQKPFGIAQLSAGVAALRRQQQQYCPM